MNSPVRYAAHSRIKMVLGFLLVAVCCTGCLTSSVRYTRGGGTGTSTSTSTSTRKAPHNVSVKQTYRTPHSLPGNRIEKVARGYLGIPYRYGGMSHRGTDCSGLVCMVYRDVSRSTLPHSTRQLRTMGRKVARSHARSGDLVFFRRGVFGRVGHVGLYLRDGVFIHASTKNGVICSNLDDSYYNRRFVEMRRIVK